MNFSIIAACDQKRGIGINNQLPWSIKADMKHFADITVGHGRNAVIMGRKTWESLPKKYRPLKERLNVVLSRQADLNLPADVLSYSSLDEALENLKAKNLEETFIIGGGSLYTEAIEYPNFNKLYITEIMSDFNCDTFFPKIPKEFKKTEESKLRSENQYRFKFVIYERSS